MKYKKVAHYDYSTGKVVSTGYRGKLDVVERNGKPRAGGVLCACKCGGEVVVISGGAELVCGCTKCGGWQYWEVVAEKTTKKAA